MRAVQATVVRRVFEGLQASPEVVYALSFCTCRYSTYADIFRNYSNCAAIMIWDDNGWYGTYSRTNRTWNGGILEAIGLHTSSQPPTGSQSQTFTASQTKSSSSSPSQLSTSAAISATLSSIPSSLSVNGTLVASQTHVQQSSSDASLIQAPTYSASTTISALGPTLRSGTFLLGALPLVAFNGTQLSNSAMVTIFNSLTAAVHNMGCPTCQVTIILASADPGSAGVMSVAYAVSGANATSEAAVTSDAGESFYAEIAAGLSGSALQGAWASTGTRTATKSSSPVSSAYDGGSGVMQQHPEVWGPVTGAVVLLIALAAWSARRRYLRRPRWAAVAASKPLPAISMAPHAAKPPFTPSLGPLRAPSFPPMQRVVLNDPVPSDDDAFVASPIPWQHPVSLAASYLGRRDMDRVECPSSAARA